MEAYANGRAADAVSMFCSAVTGLDRVRCEAVLEANLPKDCTIDGVGHFLQLQDPKPVAREIGEFLARYPMSASVTRG